MMNKIILCGFLALAFACKQKDASADKSSSADKTVTLANGEFKDLPINEFLKTYQDAALNHEAILLDVRTPPEFNDGYIPGAITINFLDEDFDKQIDMLDKSKKYFVYCQQGARSSKALVKMKQMGFDKVYNLVGGYAAYLMATSQQK